MTIAINQNNYLNIMLLECNSAFKKIKKIIKYKTPSCP